MSVQPSTTEPPITEPKRKRRPRGQRRRGNVSFVRLLALLRPYVGRLSIASVLLLLTGGIGLLFPLVVQQFVDSLRTVHDDHLLNIVAIALIGVFIVQAALSAWENYLVTSVGERLSVDLRNNLFSHLQALPLSFFDQRRTGELTSRVTNDVTVLQTSLTGNVLPILSQVVTLAGSAAILFKLDWRLTLVVLAVAPPAGIIAGVLGRQIRLATRGVQEGLGEAGVVLEEALSSPRVVKAFAREPYEARRFGTRMAESLRQALRRARAQAALGPLIGFVGFSALAIVLWYGGHEVLAGRLSVGSLLAFIIYLSLIVGPLVSFVGLYSQIQAARAAGERVFALLDEPVSVADDAHLPALPPVAGAVAFEHVTFSYERASDPEGKATSDAPAAPATRQTVLRDLDFSIQPGQVVALVGPSGAGKTTTLSLLLRLYEIDSGAIRVDGIDIRGVQAATLRAQMALVPQEPTLFGGTIADNIRYGRLDATEDEIRAAARLANALSFIDALDDGMNALVGERGVQLSAGQRQRIAIARAILRNPRILLLDEATASLDNESEALVQDALNRLMVGRTTIVVAHRLTTVERADAILVLNHGAIEERGTHTELLAQNGLYARLYTRNFEDMVDDGALDAQVATVTASHM